MVNPDLRAAARLFDVANCDDAVIDRVEQLLDTLIPGTEAFTFALDQGKDFKEALVALQTAAKEGWQSTEGMIAKIGRASRLGEHSHGVLDAGASSCWLLLNSMADSIIALL